MNSLQIKRQINKLIEELERSIQFNLNTDSTLIVSTNKYNRLKKDSLARVSFKDELEKIKSLLIKLRSQNCCPLPFTQTLVNEEGDNDLDYPLGVLDISGNYIGIANDAEEYITLWNSDVTNQAVGTLLSGTGTTFEIEYVDPEGVPFNLYGLEFYTMTSSASNAVIHVNDNDIVQFNSTAVRGSTGTNTLSSSLNEYNGTWGVSMITAIQIRRVTCTGATAGTTIRVFHSRVSERVGMNVLTPYTSFTGVLPAACKTFYVRGTTSMNWVTGITNWSDLQSIEYFSVMNLGGGSFGINNAANIPQPPASLIGLGLNDIASNATLFDLANFGWITDANLPNLRKLDIRANDGAADLAGSSAAWFATAPKVDRQFVIQNNNIGPHASAADSDTIWNNLGTALSGITPSSPATIRVEDTTAVTAASLTARNDLIAAGWTVTLT